MQVSVAQLVDELCSLGLLSAAQADEFRQASGSSDGAEPLDAISDRLVACGVLTPFQAEFVRSGRHQRLAVTDYVLVDEIGQGGMGRIYKARHRHMQRIVALKVLRGTGDPEEAARRFQREVEASARLSHPNIVTAYDAGFLDGEPYLVMEFVDGRSLSAIIRDRGPLPIPQAVEYILQAARGLAYAHSRGVVHRDVKPSNLLVDRSGTVKILDLGLARLHSGSLEVVHDEDGLTDSGQILGTVDYMAPEQARSTRDADHRSDIYSLGCTLYRCVTGAIPYDGDSVINKLVAHRERSIPPLTERRSDVPARLQELFARMVAKHPGDRWQSMREVVRELELIQRELAVASSGSTTSATFIEAAESDGETQFPAGLTNSSSVRRAQLDSQGTTVLYERSARPETPTADAGGAGGRGGTAPPGRRTARAALAAAALLVALTVVVIIRNKEGKEVARVYVPDDGSILIQANGRDITTSVTPPRAAQPAPPFRASPRETAEWVLGLGGKLIVRDRDGKTAEIDDPAKLPESELEIRRVDFRGRKNVKDDEFARVAGLPGLEQLYLGNASVSDKALAHVSGLTGLKVLDLLGTSVSDAGLKHLAALRNLSILNLSGTDVTDGGLRQLEGLTQLGQLTLSDTRVTPAGISRFQAAVPKCRVVGP